MHKEFSFIIIGSDEKIICQVEEVLMKLGLEDYHSTTSTTEGVEYIVQNDIDLVICDYDLSGMNGLEFFNNIRAEKPELPVLMIIEPESLDLTIKIISAGVNQLIVNGFTDEQMSEKIKIILDHYNGDILNKGLEETVKVLNELEIGN